MADLPPVTAVSRSVALRFQPDTDLLAGDFLRLVTSPEASATSRTIQGTEPTQALATARGLGAGYSRYYEGLVDASFFNSLNLTINSGGGFIDGTAAASAFASGRAATDATALATNVGLANISYLDRYGAPLFIGSSASPLAAIASAGSGSVLTPLPGAISSLTAAATVRGLEGAELPSLVRGGSLPFLGQPNAVVRAASELQLANEGTTIRARGSADATGIENYTIKAVPFGNGDDSASLTGDARADLRLVGGPVGQGDTVSLNGSAIGIDDSLLFGAPTLATTISGRGVASLDAQSSQASGLQASQVAVQQLQGIGITNSQLFTNQGNDVIRGFGGVASPQLPLSAATHADAAGIDTTGIYTGLGNDVIFGKILNEMEADLDANGDGIKAATVFLDHSAQDGSIGGFDGIRNSTANTGIGNDLIAGSSRGSHFFAEIGNDSIDLDRSKASSLWGGIGNDLLRINGPSQSNVLWGGIGNDSLQVKQGDDNVLDGGYGQDISTGGSGVDRFIFSEGGAAITAASTSSFGEQLTDVPFWASLNQDQKANLWDTGVLKSSDATQTLGSVDTVRDFTGGSGGDVLEISSSLASITQDLWATKGAIYGVTPAGQLSVTEASADGSNRVGVVVGSLADIHKLGIGSPSIAYATDTHQLMFDADGNWSKGSISLGTVNVNGSLTKGNFAFGSTTGNGLGPAATAQGGV